MSDKQIEQLLRQTCDTAAKHAALTRQLSEVMKSRYGVSPHDVDCDTYIDAVDYHGGSLTLAQIDAEMTSLGYPPKEAL